MPTIIIAYFISRLGLTGEFNALKVQISLYTFMQELNLLVIRCLEDDPWLVDCCILREKIPIFILMRWRKFSRLVLQFKRRSADKEWVDKKGWFIDFVYLRLSLEQWTLFSNQVKRGPFPLIDMHQYVIMCFSCWIPYIFQCPKSSWCAALKTKRLL